MPRSTTHLRCQLVLTALLSAVSGAFLHAPSLSGFRPPQPRVPNVRCAAATSSVTAQDPWLSSALKLRPPVAAGGVGTLRQEASEVVSSMGLPKRKDEAWRRCDLSSLFAARLTAPSGGADPAVSLSEEESAGMRLVLVDGAISSELSDLSALPPGVYVGGFGGLSDEAAEESLAALSALPEAGADERTTVGSYQFAALNQAGMADVACVRVDPGVEVPSPIHVVAISTGAKAGGAAGGERVVSVSHPNLFVSLGKGSRLPLLQRYVGGGEYFTNGLTRLHIGANASLEHSYIQEQTLDAVHIDSVVVQASSDGSYSTQLVQSGGRIALLNLLVNLNGAGASADVQGLSLASGSQLSDLHSAVIHHSASCTSAQEQRNALAGRARVVFRGAIVVPFGSDETEANQLCRSLLLSDNARADISPSLQIDTDDVVCTHGATIADLDDEMIFYLQSRGLSRMGARTLLLEGWARAATSKVPSESARSRAAAKAASLAAAVDEKTGIRRERMQSI